MVVRVRRNDEEDIERYCEKKHDIVLTDRKNIMGVEVVGPNHIGCHHDQMDC